MRLCIKCRMPLKTAKQEKYCSVHCQDLYLKSMWRKRNRERLNAYTREYRRAKNGGNRPPRIASLLREDVCLKCGNAEDLQLAHIKPLWAGGVHKYVVTFCRKCHHEFDVLLKDFWLINTP